jgi:type III restriction enzyme
VQILGTLLFCLDYAQQGGLGVAGVWKAVANVFADAGMKDLYDDLKKVNEIRNRHVAHSEAPLDDPDKATEAMGDWVRCINRMVKMAV